MELKHIIGKSMKWISVFVFVLMYFSSCTSQKDSYVIHEYDLSGDSNIKRYEYFVSNKMDTMATSFIVCTNSFGKVNINVICDKEYKIYMRSLYLDTVAIAEMDNIRYHKFNLSSYKELLSELALCLNKAREHFDIHQLHYISFQLADLPEIAISCSKKIGDDEITHESIDNALKVTSLKNDINKVLKQYDVEIKSINSCEEILIMRTIPYFKIHGIKEKYLPTSIIDSTIEIIVKEL